MHTIKITESQLVKVKRLIEQEEDYKKRLLHGPFKCLEYTKMDIGDGKGSKMGKRFPLIFRYGRKDRYLEFGNVVNFTGDVIFGMVKGTLNYQIGATFKCDGATLKVKNIKNRCVDIDNPTTPLIPSDSLNNIPTMGGDYNSLSDFEGVIKNIKWK